MRRYLPLVVFGLTTAVIPPKASAQAPTIRRGQMGGVPELHRNESSLGLIPGGGGNLTGDAPGASRPIIGSSAGALAPIAPPSLSDPSTGGYQNLGGPGIATTPELPPAELPLFGALALPSSEDLGPPDGLTLDAAIHALVVGNLDLRSRFYEIPQARADILTAGLYANPLLFYDSQLNPYGSYSRQRPGGPIQHDLNISHPVDLSGKRQARVRVATAAHQTIEAQYQDAVRLEIANLYEAYLGALLGREAVRFSKAALTGLDEVLETVRDQVQEKVAAEVDVKSVLIQREFAASSLVDAEQAYQSAKIRIGTLMNVPADPSEAIELRGTLRVETPPPPSSEELVQTALRDRPDLAAFRLGVQRSRADVKLALANRFADVYVLYQPFTYQGTDIAGTHPSTSWAIGVTVPLPLYNRNQGNIARAKCNVEQSKVEFASQELRVVAEVKQAEKEYVAARSAVARLEKIIRPNAEQVLRTAYIRWNSGEKDIVYYLAARRDYNDFVRQYLMAWLRYRRATLRMNTVLGRRIFL